jgi:sterol desaturase/sphingolipid hydroxylase (fatty acid hydroxylase superfamily)
MGRGFLPWMAALSALFALRVLAQAIQVVSPVTWLPPFEAWQGSGLPYGLLLLSQLVILLAMAAALWAIARDAVRPAPWAWRLCLVVGSLYFGAMALRLLLGLTLLAEGPWFASWLPSLFHLVLASFLLLFGVYLRRRARQPWRVTGRWEAMLERAAYPSVLLLGLALYPALMQAGLSISLAAYVAAAFGALMVLLHERALPYRPAWRAGPETRRTDALFLVLVQVGVPAFLSITLAVAMARLLQRNDIVLHGFWPQRWPFLAQIVLLVLASDFLRYWLHRALHGIPLLWRLHAVHHSPKGLYWLNVGRFHPIEKALQYLADVLPFALLGVAPEVLAGHFVLYAINGFYQHSNARVRLGWLNYIAAGPELHRWHHSKRPEEANHNYGNNVILWDLLFGSRFLPAARQVGKLGLLNRRYPKTFLAQLRAPFVRGLEGSEGRG